jgi:hypothetical protein
MRNLACIVAVLGVLASAPDAGATLGGPSQGQMLVQVGVSGVHVVSLGIVTLGNALSRRPWRGASYFVGSINLALSLGAVAIAGQSSCCNDDHLTTAIVLEGLAVAWATGIIVWAATATDEAPPPATAAIVPLQGGAAATFQLTL